MPSSKASVWDILNLAITRVESKSLEVRGELLIKIRVCFMRANICNPSISLHDTIKNEIDDRNKTEIAHQ